MSKIKDWQPGEWRIKVDMITPQGNRIDYYLPHVPEAAGQKVLDLATQIAADPALGCQKYDKLHRPFGYAVVGGMKKPKK